MFRRVSSLATRALTYFKKRAAAVMLLSSVPNLSAESVALEDLLLWLATYR